MGWHIQESGPAADVKKSLAAKTADYESAKAANLKKAMGAAANLHPAPAIQDPGEEKVRAAVVQVINAAVDECKGDVHINLVAFGHSQAAYNEDQIHNAPKEQREALKQMRQVTLNISIQTSV